MSTDAPTFSTPPPAGGSGLKIPILFGVVIALVAANVYLFVQLDQMRTDLAKTRDVLLTEITKLRETSSVTTHANRQHLEKLRNELEIARQQATQAAGQAKTDATRRAEELARQLKAEQERQEQAVRSELLEVRETASSTSAKLEGVSTEVGTVKTEVATAKSEIDKTIADLKRVTGDLGVTSGLVATNSKELSALRALGERNYFEFSIKKTKNLQKVGDIAVRLKKADMKRNRFTLELLADDKMVEKKDKNVNEPLQFYTLKARQPYELVINSVKKDEIAGYLSTPKVQAARTN